MSVEQDILDTHGIVPRNIWEIGVGSPELSRAAQFIERGIPIKMFEPAIPYYQQLTDAFGRSPNVDIINVALYDSDGVLNLCDAGAGSFLDGTASSAVLHQQMTELPSGPFLTTPTVCCRISRFDHGQIDVCFLDAEGCEWRILSHMVSRPRFLCIEVGIGTFDSLYVTPNREEIRAWLVENGYHVETRGEDLWAVQGPLVNVNPILSS